MAETGRSRLFQKRECTVPTWRGFLLLVAILCVLAVVIGRRLHSFLAVNDPVPGGALVVEGWAPDYAMEAAIAEFKRQHYSRIYVTGGPLLWGAPLSEYKTYAERGAAILLRLGLTTNEVQAVPAHKVQQDRTYAEAATFAAWSRTNGLSLQRVHVISDGPHARRSRLLYQKALGPKVKVGVTAVPVQDYDAGHWWRSSAGVRGVIGELLAYGYVRLFFRAPKEGI